MHIATDVTKVGKTILIAMYVLAIPFIVTVSLIQLFIECMPKLTTPLLSISELRLIGVSPPSPFLSSSNISRKETQCISTVANPYFSPLHTKIVLCNWDYIQYNYMVDK